MAQPKDAIMVNGIMLNEYLRDNESIEEEVKSKEFIREGFDGVALNRHIKEKYKPHKEKNGKVIHLGQHEINRAEYETKMIESLKTYDSKAQLVLYLLNYEGDDFLKISKIGDEVIKFVKKHNLVLNEKRIRHALRSAFGWFRHTDIFDYMIHIDRNKPGNPDNTAIFKMKPEFRDLKSDDAIAMSRNKTSSRNKNTIDKNKSVKIQPTPAKEESIDIKPLDDNKLVENIISNIQKLSTGTGALFHFDGDLVINININK